MTRARESPLAPFQFSLRVQMNNFISQFNRVLRSAYLHFDNFASSMNEAHWAIFAVIVIGSGVILMRGKPVQGS